MLATVAFGAYQAKSQTLIHYWSFNNYDTSISLPDVAHIPATYSTINVNQAIVSFQTVPGTSAAYSTYLDTLAGDVLNVQNGAAAGYAIRTRNPSDSMELLVAFPTRHYQNIVLKYETERSSASHGAQVQMFDYSINGGTTWSTANIMVNGAAVDTYATTTSWALVTVNLNDASVKDTNVLFRVRFMVNDTGTTGNNRFDNMTVQGDTLITNAVSQITNANNCSIYPNPAYSTLNVVTNTDNEKTIAIYNIAGQLVSTSVKSGKKNALDISNLANGMYFVNVTTAEGDKYRIKFIKE